MTAPRASIAEAPSSGLPAVLERSRLLVAIAAVALVLLSAVAMAWGAARAVEFISLLLNDDGWKAGKTLAPLLQTLDIFLVAAVLLVVGLGLWELFVGDLDLPEWLTTRSLHELKASTGDLIVLVVAIKYVERFAAGGRPLDLLYEAGAVALLGGTLIAFTTLRSGRHGTGDGTPPN